MAHVLGRFVASYDARTEAGVDRLVVVHWNVIPYYLGTDTKFAYGTPATSRTRDPCSSSWLPSPELRSVILGGDVALTGWRDHKPRGELVREFPVHTRQQRT